MSLNRSIPGGGLKSQGFFFPSALRLRHVSQLSPGAGRAGVAHRAPPPHSESGRGCPGSLGNAAFLAIGGLGFRRRTPDCHRQEERPVWGWRPIRLTPAPHPHYPIEIPFGIFLRGECVALSKEPREDSQPPRAITRGGGQGWRPAPGKASEEAGGLQAAGGRGALGACSNFHPEAGGRAN